MLHILGGKFNKDMWSGKVKDLYLRGFIGSAGVSLKLVLFLI